jgi:hypothetical protein
LWQIKWSSARSTVVAADGPFNGCLDPEATAAEILAFQEGALILWRLDPDNTDLRTLYEHFLRRLLPSTASEAD